MKLTAHPYTLHFKRPAATSRGALFTKQAVFLAATHADLPGVAGWGECSPMPGLSVDDFPDYVDKVQAVCAALNAGCDMHWHWTCTELPSVAFGLEIALRDLQDRGQAAAVRHSLQPRPGGLAHAWVDLDG